MAYIPQKKLARGIREDLLRSFYKVGGMNYLVELAYKYPKTYVSMLAKLVPSEINASVTHTTIDIKAIMAEAEARLSTGDSTQHMIDVTPDSAEPGAKVVIDLDDLL